MTAVRIAHAEPRPGNLGNGTFLTHGYLVVLADDAGHRAMPFWFRGQPGGGSLARLLDRSNEDLAPAGSPEELITRLLRAAGANVTEVDIDVAEAGAGEQADVGGMDPAAYTARVGLAGPAGTTHVTVPLGLGLAMAAAGGAPVRMPGAVLDRQAVPVQGDDLLGPLLDLVPEVGRAPGGRVAGWPARLPAKRPRYEPRNLDFADGLDRWELDGSFLRDGDLLREADGGSGRQDYLAAVEGSSAVLSAAVERPAGSAALMQTIFADDYHGATVVFRGEMRTEPLTYEAAFRLEVLRERRTVRDDRAVTISGRSTWTPYEVTAVVPGDADRIRFGISLAGRGLVALRGAELTRRS